MSDHLTAARAALTEEISDLTERLCRATNALAILDGVDEPVTPMVPLVRPPAPSVPEPPVQLPKLPKRQQRPAASGARRPRWDYAACAKVAREAIVEGKPAAAALVGAFDGMTPQQASFLVADLRKRGYDIPYTRRKFTAEPITKLPVDEQAARNAAAGPTAGAVPWQPTARPTPALSPTRTPRFNIDDAHQAIADADAQHAEATG